LFRCFLLWLKLRQGNKDLSWSAGTSSCFLSPKSRRTILLRRGQQDSFINRSSAIISGGQDRSDRDATPEIEPRDFSASSIAVEEVEVERWTVQSATVLEELVLPLNTMEQLGKLHDDAGTSTIYQYGDTYDGLIVVEGQNSATGHSEASNPIAPVDLDDEEQKLQANFQTLLQRPTFFTPVQPRPWLSQDSLFYSRHDEPSFTTYFQQAITGLATDYSLADSLATDISRTGERFSDGLILSENQEISVFQPSFNTTPLDQQSLIDSGSLSQNLLSIIQRPSFISASSARWTAPPQWLQFQMLRNDEEGLMVSEYQQLLGQNQAYSGPTNSFYGEDVQSQVQINLQGLLPNLQSGSIPVAAPRSQIPKSWA
jgi:hypothetical protein